MRCKTTKNDTCKRKQEHAQQKNTTRILNKSTIQENITAYFTKTATIKSEILNETFDKH